MLEDGEDVRWVMLHSCKINAIFLFICLFVPLELNKEICEVLLATGSLILESRLDETCSGYKCKNVSLLSFHGMMLCSEQLLGNYSSRY